MSNHNRNPNNQEKKHNTTSIQIAKYEQDIQKKKKIKTR